MSNIEDIFPDLKLLLKRNKVSNYAINAYLTLLKRNNLNATEIHRKSNIPIGRIYEVLSELNQKGLIEIYESRPKIYRATSPNFVIHNLLTLFSEEKKKEIAEFTSNAKNLEFKLQQFNFNENKESPKIFWSTTYGSAQSLSLYMKKFDEAQEEVLLTSFINENTLKVLEYAENFYRNLQKSSKRGVMVKILWCFERDRFKNFDKSLADKIYNKLISIVNNTYKILPQMESYEMKYTLKRIPTYYDIFDSKFVVIKLQDPLEPRRIFACVNIFDPELANRLKQQFDSLWGYEAIG